MNSPLPSPISSNYPGKSIGISLIGSTGSIGTQTLEVIDAHPGRFHVVALAAKSQAESLIGQAKKYCPELVVTDGPVDPDGLNRIDARRLHGIEGLLAAATHPGADIVVMATSGHAAIEPTIAAIRHGKTIALANKETIVCGGEFIIPLAARHSATIRPVDSEHSAIWQCLAGASTSQVSRLILTASGGAFRETPLVDLERVTVDDALKHPTWKMGKKITIDSATMVNKALELIEARWLFDIDCNRIEIVIHPESIVHSIVEFVDGSQISQMSWPDMRLPIQLALTYPERVAGLCRPLDLAEAGSLTFHPLDPARFPAVELAREAVRRGGSYPTALSAADEVAVDAFIRGILRFTDIERVIRMTMDDHQPALIDSVESILDADRRSREEANRAVKQVANL